MLCTQDTIGTGVRSACMLSSVLCSAELSQGKAGTIGKLSRKERRN